MATAFKTYDATAIREDLSDVIYDISPTDTPFMSSIAGKGSVSNTLFEWQTEAQQLLLHLLLKEKIFLGLRFLF